MKKILLILAMIVGVFAASARDTYSHDINVLPVAAQTTIKNNFKADISHFKIDKDLGRISEYDVVLTDGTEITFDKNGNWKDVEVRRNGAVPSALVPKDIATYVNQNQKKPLLPGSKKRNRDMKLSYPTESR